MASLFLRYKNFNYKKFKEEINGGDIWGLEYLENTIIASMKEKNKNTMNYTKEDYIISLFYAVLELNRCNDIYETSDVENNFNYDLYFDLKGLLLQELGFNIDNLYH